jgi:hypothetical protein
MAQMPLHAGPLPTPAPGLIAGARRACGWSDGDGVAAATAHVAVSDALRYVLEGFAYPDVGSTPADAVHDTLAAWADGQPRLMTLSYAGPQTPQRDAGVARLYEHKPNAAGRHALASADVMEMLVAFGATRAGRVLRVLDCVANCPLRLVSIHGPPFVYQCGHAVCYEAASEWGRHKPCPMCNDVPPPAQSCLALRF